MHQTEGTLGIIRLDLNMYDYYDNFLGHTSPAFRGQAMSRRRIKNQKTQKTKDTQPNKESERDVLPL